MREVLKGCDGRYRQNTLPSLPVRIALVSIAALLVSVPVRNESNKDRDGNWWISQEQLAKYSYMVGYFDRMELGEDISIRGTMKYPKG